MIDSFENFLNFKLIRLIKIIIDSRGKHAFLQHLNNYCTLRQSYFSVYTGDEDIIVGLCLNLIFLIFLTNQKQASNMPFTLLPY